MVKKIEDTISSEKVCNVCLIDIKNPQKLKRHKESQSCKSFAVRVEKYCRKHSKGHDSILSIRKLMRQNNEKEKLIEKLEAQNNRNKEIIQSMRKNAEKIEKIMRKFLPSDEKHSNLFEIIEEMDSRKNTKLNYTSTAKNYHAFCIKKGYDYSNIEAANFYIKTRKDLNSQSKRTLKNNLQSLLRIKNQKNIKLDQVRIKDDKKDKYFVSTKEIEDFLEDCRTKNYEFFIIFSLIDMFLLRVHGISNMKYKHLSDKPNANNMYELTIPYTKTNKYKVELKFKDFQIIEEFVSDRNHKEDYIFFKDIIKEERDRTDFIQKKLNKFIKESPVFKTINKSLLTCYIFRRGGAQILKEKEMKTNKKVAKRLGHSNNIFNTKYYLKK